MMGIGTYVFGLSKKFAKAYLFNSTLDTFRDALYADSVSDAAAILLEQAASRRDEFWMDVMLLAVVLLVILLMANCMVRCFCWICVGLPKEHLELEKMRQGKLDYQIKAQKEKEERRRREAAGEEEPMPSLQDDMQMINHALNTVRQSMEARGQKPNVDPITVPAAAAFVSGESEREFVASTRPGARAVPSSIIRGLPSVDVLVASPGEKFMLVGCRSKRKTNLYPLPAAEGADFLKNGKALQEEHFISVQNAAAEALGVDVHNVEIVCGAFSVDDARLVVGERSSDTFLAFALAAGRLQHLWSLKLPDRRLVTSLPNLSVAGTDALITVYDKDCVVERICRESASSVTSSKNKFRVGNALAWAVRDGTVAVGGSFIQEPRVARAVPNTGGRAGFSLEAVCTLPQPEKAPRMRVLAMAFVTKGTPAFNTRQYLIVFYENGVGFIYAFESFTADAKFEKVCTFSDTAFASFDTSRPVHIITSVMGKAYQERLRIGLWRGGDVSVHHQAATASAEDGKFEMQLLADLHEVQEGDPIKEAIFIQQGRGVATCGHDDKRHLRLFTLPA